MDGCLAPVMLPPNTALAPDGLLKIVKCECKKNRPCHTRRCSCNNSGMSCTIVCFCIHANAGTITIELMTKSQKMTQMESLGRT